MSNINVLSFEGLGNKDKNDNNNHGQFNMIMFTSMVTYIVIKLISLTFLVPGPSGPSRSRATPCLRCTEGEVVKGASKRMTN